MSSHGHGLAGADRRLERLLFLLPDSLAAASLAAVVGDDLAEDARAFGLLPLLAHYLPEEFPLPRQLAYSAKFRAARVESSTVDASTGLEDAGVEAIALKGAVHASRLYPKPWLRPAGDVDLLVRAEDADRAKEILEASGWSLLYDPRDHPLDFQHSVNFTGRGGLMLELHWVLATGFQSRFDGEQLFARSRWHGLGTGQIRILGAGDDVVFQAAHAAAHIFTGVKWLFDLKLTVREGGFCWDEVIALARKAEVSMAAGMALFEARRRVGADVPAWVIERMAPGMVRRAAAIGIEAIPQEHAKLRSSALGLLLTDRLSARWALRLGAPALKRLAWGVNRVARGLHAGPLVPSRFEPASTRRR